MKGFLKIFSKINLKWLILVSIFLAGLAGGFLIFKASQKETVSPLPQNTYLSFILESYDTIKGNYWKAMTDAELANLFELGSETLMGVQYSLKTNDKSGVELLAGKILKELPEEKRKEYTTKLVSVILNSLSPAGRNALYSQQDEKDLADKVQNVNPGNDLYQNLGAETGASTEEIKTAYEAKVAELETQQTPEAQEKLKEATYAYNVLSDSSQKEKYDSTGAEPTVFAKLLTSDIAHIYIKRFSPTTFEEFQNLAAGIAQKGAPTALILDLRDNIGGSIDLLPYFLGPFIGQNQYAYEFFHQGEYTPYKTKIGWIDSLTSYKTVVILVNGNTQSTAELMASTLKKYNVGVLVGTTTRGWGTIEKVFQLQNQIDTTEKYSMFLVHSLTLGEDNQPIESNGVAPTININDQDWKEQLLKYFHYSALVTKVTETWNQSPEEY
jgi:hypothetical protein